MKCKDNAGNLELERMHFSIEEFSGRPEFSVTSGDGITGTVNILLEFSRKVNGTSYNTCLLWAD